MLLFAWLGLVTEPNSMPYASDKRCHLSSLKQKPFASTERTKQSRSQAILRFEETQNETSATLGILTKEQMNTDTSARSIRDRRLTC